MPLCQPKYLAVLAYAIAAAAVHTISAAAAAAYLHCSPGYWRPCPGPDHLLADGEGPGVAGGVHHTRARPPDGPAGWDYLRARSRGASVTSSVTSTPANRRMTASADYVPAPISSSAYQPKPYDVDKAVLLRQVPPQTVRAC